MKNSKAAAVMELLNEGYSVKEIRLRMKVTPSYIYMLKKQMAHKVEEPQTEEAVEKGDVDAILDERASTYGNFIDVARMAQRLKNVAHTAAGDQGKTFAADQAEALDMIFSKLARIINGDSDHVDSWIDVAGYAKLVSDRLEGRIR
jgi:hypothetical protein